jgi:hypothetical protein
MIVHGVEDGSVAVDDSPRVTAGTLYGLRIGASMIAKIDGSPSQLDRVIAVTRQILHVWQVTTARGFPSPGSTTNQQTSRADRSRRGPHEYRSHLR